MAIITSFTASRSAKVNIGNYESRDASFSVTVEIEPGDDAQSLINSAWATAQAEVSNQIDIITKGDYQMPIKGLTTNRTPSFPEIGSIRKGAKKTGNRPGVDLDHFRVEFSDTDTDSSKRFVSIYGNEPRAINIMMPFDDIDQCFDAWREAYTSGGLVHRCDGEIVHYPPSERGQPCTLKDHADKRQRCKPVGRLRVILPELARLGYMTVHTTSVYDIMNITQNLAAIQQMAGRLTGIPMILRRVEREISTPSGDGKRKRYKKWLLFIEIAPEWVQTRLAAMNHQAMLDAGVGLALGAGVDDFVIDGDAVEVIDEPQSTHWIDNDATRRKFWAYAKGTLMLSEDEVHEALGVERVRDFVGGKNDALAAMKSAAETKNSAEAEPVAEPSELEKHFDTVGGDGSLEVTVLEYGKGAGLKKAKVLKILGVSDIAEYTGTVSEAKAMIDAFVDGDDVTQTSF